MTRTDYLALLDGLDAHCPVRASELLDDHHEVEIGDTLMYLQWGEDDAGIALTVPLPDVLPGEGATPGDLAALYRLVLQRQWQQSSDDGVSFGALPITGELVGMVVLAGEAIGDPDRLQDELRSALVAVETAWYEIAGQWLTENTQPHPLVETPPAASDALLRA